MGTLVGLTTVTKTAAYTCSSNDALVLVDCTNGAITITLPTAASVPGQQLQIKKIDSSTNGVTVSRQGTDTIEGAVTDVTIEKQYSSKTYLADGVNGIWYIVSWQRPGGTNIKLDTCFIEVGQQSAPANPASGSRRLFVDSSDGKMKVRTSGGSSVSLEEQDTGETNTASNVGTAGVGVFKQKSGVDLQFKKINAGSAKITITDDVANDEVDVDVVTGSSSTSVCVGNDSRLSDSRAPTGTASGDLTGSYPGPTVGNNAITYAKMQDVSATDKVIGRSTAGAGDPEEIACTAAGRALIDDADAAAQRTTLGLGALAVKATVATADIDNDAVTYAKMQNISATDRVLGRSTAGAGDTEEITCTAAGRALIDDADAPAQRTTLGLGALATKATIATADIDNNAVDDTKIRDGVATSVIGRSANSTGDPADIAATVNGQVLRRAAGVLGFGQVDVSDGTNAVTGALAIGNGGTGQITQQAAFNALDPLTAKGGIIVHDGTNSVQLTVGANNTVLTADSVQTNGVRWGAGTEPWESLLHIAWGNGNPTIDPLQFGFSNTAITVAGPTPTGIGTSVGRLVAFRFKTAITVNTIRWFGVAVVTAIYTSAIYKDSGGSRIWNPGSITTAASAWSSNTAGGLPFTLAADTLYWFGLGANAAGTTSGFRSAASPIASSLGVVALPGRLPQLGGRFAQVALTAGSWPATLPALSNAAFASAGATGTLPLFFLEN